MDSAYCSATSRVHHRPPNDPRQYDDLAHEWWRPGGAFAALHWLAEARRHHIPPPQPGAVLVDLGCGGGLLAPHVQGYRHLGVDLSHRALATAREHGVDVVQGDVRRLPLSDEVADVVVAGELFEHVPDLARTVAEAVRLLRPGGLLLFDTINATRFARIGIGSAAEHVPGGPARGIHDPRLFVPVSRLRGLLDSAGITDLELWGLRPSIPDYLRYLRDRSRGVRMIRTRSLAGLYQGVGRKR